MVLFALTLVCGLLLQPHASIHTTLLQQLLMPAKRVEGEGCRVLN